MTLGEYRVGISFNPSSNPAVDAIKRAAADFIDLVGAEADDSEWKEAADKFIKLCYGIQQPDDIPERKRLIGIAVGCIDSIADDEDGIDSVQILIEDAAMWAVKAATKGPME